MQIIRPLMSLTMMLAPRLTQPFNNNNGNLKIPVTTNPVTTNVGDVLNSFQDNVESKIREVLRMTIMAPSSHNTQCWKFQIDNIQDSAPCVTMLPDFNRACPVVDPDDHHLYVTLGCAMENFVHAALAFGWETQIHVDHDLPRNGVKMQLKPISDPVVTELFQAIPNRQVTRCNYDGKLLSSSELTQLQEAGSNPDKGISMVIISSQDADRMQKVQDLIVEGNTMQLNNPNFMKELSTWVRFNKKESVEKGDGLSGECTGNKMPAPRWVGNFILNHVISPKSENPKVVQQLQTSAGVAIFVTQHNDPQHWIEVGRCYERFALKATSMGIRNAFLNQPVEEASVRVKLAQELGLDKSARPDLLVRFGRGPQMPFSPRRPLENVIIGEN